MQAKYNCYFFYNVCCAEGLIVNVFTNYIFRCMFRKKTFEKSYICKKYSG
jgi:hypothetical protein